MDYSIFIDSVGKFIDLLGVIAIIFGTVYSIINFILEYIPQRNINSPYKELRQNLGRTIIIGLELLIAGDIIRSIAVPPNIQTVGVLAIIVLIRAFLSIQMEQGTEWRLPWNHRKEKS